MSNVLSPTPQGKYVPAKRYGDLVFVSGMTPRQEGRLRYDGQVAVGVPPEHYRPAAELATQNPLRAACGQLTEGEALCDAVSPMVYIDAPPGYTEHSKIADLVSAVLREELRGDVPSRAAVGVSTLPGCALLEISLIVGVESA